MGNRKKPGAQTPEGGIRLFGTSWLRVRGRDVLVVLCGWLAAFTVVAAIATLAWTCARATRCRCVEVPVVAPRGPLGVQ